ncbi:MAG: RraA family protein [Bacillota bacterium]
MNSKEKSQFLKLYEDLRVADVRDGFDTLGYHHVGSMNHQIRPLFRTRIRGIARTVRYVPFRGVIPQMTPEKYWSEWVGMYYRDICPYPWVEDIEEGDIMVIDQSSVDAGLCGSENTLNCLKRGLMGFVSNGGVRDTDEVIMQKVPFWCQFVSQKMVQGRLQFDAKDVPVSVGGVLVNPGDIVVADGDGVIVVPLAMAEDVARYAHEEHRRDKKNRRKHYEDLGWNPDHTL